MENTKWKIEVIKSIDAINDNCKILSEASWICIAENETQKSHISGTVFFENSINQCVICDELTEEDVLNLCFENGLNKEDVESQVKQKLNKNKKPQNTDLPWNLASSID